MSFPCTCDGSEDAGGPAQLCQCCGPYAWAGQSHHHVSGNMSAVTSPLPPPHGPTDSDNTYVYKLICLRLLDMEQKLNPVESKAKGSVELQNQTD